MFEIVSFEQIQKDLEKKIARGYRHLNDVAKSKRLPEEEKGREVQAIKAELEEYERKLEVMRNSSSKKEYKEKEKKREALMRTREIEEGRGH